MAVLTEDQVYALRRKVGDRPTDAELQAIYDRTGSLTETAREILETRLANFMADPANFSVPGEYSQGTEKNIDALTRALASLGDLDDDIEDGLPFLRIHRPSRRAAR